MEVELGEPTKALSLILITCKFGLVPTLHIDELVMGRGAVQSIDAMSIRFY